MHQTKPLSGASILVVEDEPVIAFDLNETLTDGGAEVVLARSVTEALRLAHCKKIDAALLDVRLGDGVVTPVAEELATKAIPFVFHTAYARQHCKELQSWPKAKVIPKPAPPTIIIEALAALISE